MELNDDIGRCDSVTIPRVEGTVDRFMPQLS